MLFEYDLSEGLGIDVEKLSTAEDNNFATYIIKQGGVQVGEKINVPKDFVVKSGSVKTAPASPGTALTNAGVGANEKYISLIINSADSNTGGSELIIPAKDLIESVVTFSQTQASGANTYEIGKLTINGVTTTIYGKDTNTTYTASSVVGNADTSAGAVGTSTAYARADHVHKQSDIYSPKSHATNATTYGAGTTSNYGHVKLVENLTTNAGDGLALGAGQGKALKTLVDAKVNTSDIKDNLTSTDTNKPLSAAQGKELKTQIDNIVSGTTATNHNHDNRYYTESEVDTKLNGKANSSHTHSDEQITLTSSAANAVTPLDMAIGEIFNANRLAYLPPANITVKYSTNNGSTWTDYGTTNENKANLISADDSNKVSFIAGKNATASTNNQLLIDIDAGGGDLTSSNSNVYMVLRKIMIYFSTGGGGNCKVTVQTATYAAPTTFTTKGTYDLGGYSGWNSIPLNITFGGFKNQTDHIKYVRFIFYRTSDAKNFSVQNIRFFGETAWIVSSNMAKYGHIYSYDINQNATFPAKIIKSGGTNTQLLLANGDTKATTDFATSGHTHTKSQITDFPTSMTPTSHTHGSITNDGKVGTTATLPLITGTGGVVQAGSFGTTAGTFCQGNDSRLSNARTPTAHQADTNAYGAATTAKWGHTKLNSATNSTDETTAATPKAVKVAYDLANGKPSLGTTSTTAAKGDHTHDYSNTYAPKTHTHASSDVTGLTASKNVVTGSDGKLTTENKPTIPTKTSQLTNDSNFLTSHQSITGKADKTNGASQITDTNANNYTNIGSLSSGATQQAINSAINTKIASLTNIDLVKLVTSLPTASASTMNQLYVVAKSGGATNDGYNIYVTVKNGSSYAWEKVDDFDLQTLSIAWSSVTGKPTIDTSVANNANNLVTSQAVYNGLNNKLDKTNTSQKGKALVTNSSTGTVEYWSIDSSAGNNASNLISSKAVYDGLSGKANTHNHPYISTNAGSVGTTNLADKSVTPVKLNGFELINSTHTSSTSTWLGTSSRISSLVAGTVIYYKLKQDPTTTDVTLNLTLSNGSTTTGAKNVYYDGNRLKNQYKKNQLIPLLYDGTNWIVISPYTDTNTTYSAATGTSAVGLVKISDNYTSSAGAASASVAASSKAVYDTYNTFAGTGTTKNAHTHGSIGTGGTLNSDITATNINKVVVTDSSNNIKSIAKSSFASYRNGILKIGE